MKFNNKFLRLSFKLLENLFIIILIPIIIIIRLIKPIIYIRLGKIRNHAFGMHIFAIASYQKQKEQSKVQSIDLFFYQNNKILNTYLNTYTKKRFNINFIYK